MEGFVEKLKIFTFRYELSDDPFAKARRPAPPLASFSSRFLALFPRSPHPRRHRAASLLMRRLSTASPGSSHARPQETIRMLNEKLAMGGLTIRTLTLSMTQMLGTMRADLEREAARGVAPATGGADGSRAFVQGGPFGPGGMPYIVRWPARGPSSAEHARCRALLLPLSAPQSPRTLPRRQPSPAAAIAAVSINFRASAAEQEPLARPSAPRQAKLLEDPQVRDALMDPTVIKAVRPASPRPPLSPPGRERRRGPAPPRRARPLSHPAVNQSTISNQVQDVMANPAAVNKPEYRDNPKLALLFLKMFNAQRGANGGPPLS